MVDAISNGFDDQSKPKLLYSMRIQFSNDKDRNKIIVEFGKEKTNSFYFEIKRTKTSIVL